MTPTWCLSLLALLGRGLVEGARSRIKRSSAQPAKFIAGVPVLNYHKAMGSQEGATAAGVASEENWLVVMDDTAQDSDMHELCAKSASVACSAGHPSKGGVPFIGVRGTEKELEAILKGAGSAARFVEPDPVVRLLDPEVEMELSAASSGVWNVQRVGGPTARTTGRGVHVYVVDSGVRTTHVDFGGRAIPTLDMTTGKECKGDVNCATDSVGHGTHCAGTAGGATYGLATQSTVHAVKISFDGDGTWTYPIGAFDWIATKGAKPAVVSASFGGEGEVPSLTVAVDALLSAGVTVLTSAGNSGAEACAYTPANMPDVLSVGASGTQDEKAYFSNYGSCVHIWAPGTQITSASSTSDTGSMVKQGTSMACPLVAGGVALLLEATPSLSPAQVRRGLLNKALDGLVTQLTAEDTNKLLWVGTGTPPPPGEFEPCRRRRRIMCFK